MKKNNKILIIGGGLAGTALAIRLLQYASEPQTITLMEERDDYRHGGIAYSSSGLGAEHIFNIQAGRMSVFREDPDDFINWANKEADRSHWPDRWKRVRFHESSAAPRQIYPDYLKNRLEHAQKQAAAGVSLEVVSGKAIDITSAKEGVVDVSFENPTEKASKKSQTSVFSANHVVLATGHEQQEPAAPTIDTVEIERRKIKRIRRPYSKEGRDAILGIDKHATVHVTGSFLTSDDTVLTLLNNGHKGHIILVSRSGLHPWDYPENHKHAVIKLPVPEFVSQDVPIDRRIDMAFQEMDSTWLSMVNPDATIQQNNVVRERILKAWEPHMATLLKKLPPEDAKKFTREVLGVFTRLRTGIMPEAAQQLMQAMSVTLENGIPQLLDIHDKEEYLKIYSEVLKHKWHTDPSAVIDRARKSIETPDVIIDPMQRQADYTKVSNPLWRNLIDTHHLAETEPKTGQGVQLSEHYQLVDAAGHISPNIFVTGIPAEGHERVTKGRIGAFAFNLAAVKDQSVFIANAILDAQRTKSAPTASVDDGDRKKASPLLESASAKLQDAEVACLTAKSRHERERAQKALEAEKVLLKGALDRAGLLPPVAEVLISEAEMSAKSHALTKLTDISITPRDLSNSMQRQRA